MEREFFALWQGVTGHERLIKGFKCYCYIDHRNNLFNEALLENRRIAKKMLGAGVASVQYCQDMDSRRGKHPC